MNAESNVAFKGKIFPRSCSVCGVFYQSARHYFVHSRKKVACRPKPYTCSECGRVFNYYWNLIAHEKRKYSCRSASAQEKAEKTVRSPKTNTSFVCSKCGTLFCYQKSYEKHCRKCQSSDAPDSAKSARSPSGDVFQDRPELATVESRPSTEVEEVPEDPPNSEGNAARRRHSFGAEAARPENRFVCKICDYSFVGAYAWSKHMKKHPSFKMPSNCFGCPVCGEVFYSAYILFRHQKRNQHWKRASSADDGDNEDALPPDGSVESENEGPAPSEGKDAKKVAGVKKEPAPSIARKPLDRPKCPTCGKFVARSRGKSTSFDHYFPCKWCSEQFRTAETTSGRRPSYECVRCDRRPTSRSRIQDASPEEVEVKREEKRNDESDAECGDKSKALERRSFRCSVCGSVFRDVTGYVSHSLNHFNSNRLDPNEISRDKPYECEICPEKFTHHQKVQMHFLRHLKTVASPSRHGDKGAESDGRSSLSVADGAGARLQIAKKSIFVKTDVDARLGARTGRSVYHYRGEAGSEIGQTAEEEETSGHDGKCPESSRKDANSRDECACGGCGPRVFPEVNRFLGLSDRGIREADASDGPRTLRNHFSRLLFLLVDDPELMRSLGWGKRRIDDILEEVLRHLGRKPAEGRDGMRRFRSNISLFFEVCIKDAVMEKLKSGCASTEELVVNMLLLCENSLKN
ncbi:zinc finger protein 700-like [Centruroides sculpturatus]|uniref:zinc finger protein 700-like n=1 Tax=Centruroides sculpturatus TaxID=218467 RepID=UPI000C6E7589|nr:zinc finger protein 700-like [Centruroides sculpturatus]